MSLVSHSSRVRTLMLEELERRYPLAAVCPVVPAKTTDVTYGLLVDETDYPKIIDRTFEAPRNGYLRIHTNVYGQEKLIAGENIWAEFTNGQIAHVLYDAKSLNDFLDDYVPLDEFDEDEFAGVQVSLSVEYEDRDANYFCVGTEKHYVVRYVSAVFPGTNKIDLGLAPPFTTYSIVSNLEDWLFVRPSISIDPTSEDPDAFAIDSSTITFRPPDPKHLDGYFANLDVTVQGIKVGSLRVQAVCLVARTWSLDAHILQAELDYAVSKLPLSARALLLISPPKASAVLSQMNSMQGTGFSSPSYGGALVAAAQGTASQISVQFDRYAENCVGKVGSFTPLSGSEELASSLLTLAAEADNLNDRRLNHRVDQIIEPFLRVNESPVPRIEVQSIVNAVVDVSLNYAVASYIEKAVAKNIAHELGHAAGFAAHIVPKIPGLSGPFDVMQQGVVFDSVVRIMQSASFFYVLADGATSSGAARSMLNALQSVPAPGRYHDIDETGGGSGGSCKTVNTNLANHRDVDGNEAISPNDALSVINFINAYGSQEIFAGDARITGYSIDVNSDGWASPADALEVINWINANRSQMRGASIETASGNPTAATDEVMALFGTLFGRRKTAKRG